MLKLKKSNDIIQVLKTTTTKNSDLTPLKITWCFLYYLTLCPVVTQFSPKSPNTVLSQYGVTWLHTNSSKIVTRNHLTWTESPDSVLSHQILSWVFWLHPDSLDSILYYLTLCIGVNSLCLLSPDSVLTMRLWVLQGDRWQGVTRKGYSRLLYLPQRAVSANLPDSIDLQPRAKPILGLISDALIQFVVSRTDQKAWLVIEVTDLCWF